MIWKKDLQTAAFWGCIAMLLGASLFFGLSVEQRRRDLLGGEGRVDNGSVVRLVRVIDGDTVIVANEAQQPATIRILGIKAFEAAVEKEASAPYGQAALETLRQLMTDRPIRVLLHSIPKDRYGRTIAALYAGDRDIGLHLVREGLAVVYTLHPFAAMPFYLKEQELARAERRGFWANAEVSARALALMHEWQERAGE